MAQMDVQDIPLNKIKLGKNCRLDIKDDDIAGLMQAIKAQGLLQPPGVIKRDGGTYELCYGNRRFLACSKLGWTTIPCVVNEPNGEHSRDLKNLTENMQRKPISLIECGRWIKALEKQGLTQAEMSVRIGMSVNMIRSCALAYTDVPSDYRDDIEMNQGNYKIRPGKISITAARTIMNAQKSFGLDKGEISLLFKAAKENDKFTEASVPKYAMAIKRGNRKHFVERVKPTTVVRLQFLIDGNEADRLREKHIDKGIYKSLSALMVAILKGDKSERIKIL